MHTAALQSQLQTAARPAGLAAETFPVAAGLPAAAVAAAAAAATEGSSISRCPLDSLRAAGSAAAAWLSTGW
jgi:hypothetical protein